jgi:multiple sugar transport system permease protein
LRKKLKRPFFLPGFLRSRIDTKLEGWLFLAPLLLLLIGLALIPILYAMGLSFWNYNVLRPERTAFVGLDNFTLLFEDERFRVALLNSLSYVGVCVPLSMFIGVGAALLLDHDLPGMRIFRALVIMPMMVMPLVVGLNFRMLFDYQSGLVNWLLNRVLNLPRVNWLETASGAFWATVIMEMWFTVPFVIMLTLAGLKSLPTDVYEAAHVDGAGKIRTFFYMTLPLLMPVLSVIILLRTLTTFKLFDQIYSLTEGGPGSATETVSYYAYVIGFKRWDVGYAALLSYVLVFIIALVCLVLLKLLQAVGNKV